MFSKIFVSGIKRLSIIKQHQIIKQYPKFTYILMYTFTSHKHKVMLSRFKVGDSVLTFDAIVPVKQKQRMVYNITLF